ncbi:unnamed protein product [Rhizophagus irregularis]|nr:unnamed protein product [Rhizophagus irregularis]
MLQQRHHQRSGTPIVPAVISVPDRDGLIKYCKLTINLNIKFKIILAGNTWTCSINSNIVFSVSGTTVTPKVNTGCIAVVEAVGVNYNTTLWIILF